MTRERARTGTGPTRRDVLVATGVAGAAALAGCLGGDDAPEPVSLDDEQVCDECGMVIEHHPGPVGQAFYDEDLPEGRDGPAWFCSGTCTYTWVFDQEDRGHEPTIIYATDYSTVDWELSGEDGVTFISAHLEAENQVDVTDLTMVVGSDVHGAMGEELIGFSDRDDAESFADEHGGELVTHDQVTRELIDSLGGM